jgi:hypothetical protein
LISPRGSFSRFFFGVFATSFLLSFLTFFVSSKPPKPTLASNQTHTYQQQERKVSDNSRTMPPLGGTVIGAEHPEAASPIRKFRFPKLVVASLSRDDSWKSIGSSSSSSSTSKLDFPEEDKKKTPQHIEDLKKTSRVVVEYGKRQLLASLNPRRDQQLVAAETVVHGSVSALINYLQAAGLASAR